MLAGTSCSNSPGISNANALVLLVTDDNGPSLMIAEVKPFFAGQGP